MMIASTVQFIAPRRPPAAGDTGSLALGGGTMAFATRSARRFGRRHHALDGDRPLVAILGLASFDASTRTVGPTGGSRLAENRHVPPWCSLCSLRPLEKRLRTVILSHCRVEAFGERAQTRPVAGWSRLRRRARVHDLWLTCLGGSEVDAGGCRQVLAELIAEDSGAHLFHSAVGQIEQLERSERESDEAVHLQSDMLEHPLDLAVLAFAQPHGQPAIAALNAIELGLDTGVGDTVNLNSGSELVERGLIGDAFRAHPIAAEPTGVRQLQHAGETAVVGQQKEAFGVDVEPADGDGTRPFRPVLTQEVRDGFATFRIVIARHQTARLVEQEQSGFFRRWQGCTIDEDPVIRTDVAGRARQDLAIHLDAAGENPGFGITT